MVFVRFVLFIVLTSVVLPSALAQQRDPKTKKSSRNQPAANREAEELRLNAVSLLHSLAQSANEIDNVADRVRVLAEIGDAFWSVDAEHARSVLLRSFKEIEKLPAGADAESLASQKRSLRRLVLSRIAAREPALANQIVRDLPSEIPTDNEKAMQQQGIATPNAEALLGIARPMIESDPNRAAALASYSVQVQDGLSQQFRLFLIRLRAKDPVLADGVFITAMKHATSQHPGRLFDVLVLWDYAYQPQDFYYDAISWSREKDEPRFTTSLDLKRSVLAFAVTAIVENLQQLPSDSDSTQNRNLFHMHLRALHSVIQQLLPAMQADLPRGSADLQQALVRIEQEIRANNQSLPARPSAEITEAESNPVDSLIEKAAAESFGDGRDNLYLGAAFKLFQQGQYEKGKEIAAKIDNQERRAMILEPLNFRLAGELVEKNSLQEALNTANQLKTPELRIAALARVGRAFIDTGDSQSGVQTLNAAQSIVSKADATLAVSGAALRIARAFVKSDPLRTAEAITLAIQIANKVKPDETPWVLMGSADAEDRFHLSWRNTPDGGVSSVEIALAADGGLAELLAKLEFNQAISLAKTINSKPLSLAAQAAICRSVI